MGSYHEYESLNNKKQFRCKNTEIIRFRMYQTDMKKNQMEVLDMKNIIIKIENSEDGLNKLDKTDGTIRKVLIRYEELTQNVAERDKERKHEKIVRDKEDKTNTS